MNTRFAGNEHQRLPRQVDLRADAEPFALRRLLRHALYDKHVAAFNLHALFQRQKSVEFLPDFHKRRMYGRPNCLYASVIERFRLPVRCTALQMKLDQFAIFQHRCARSARLTIDNQFSFHLLQINQRNGLSVLLSK